MKKRLLASAMVLSVLAFSPINSASAVETHRPECFVAAPGTSTKTYDVKGERLTGVPSIHTASLAAQSYPAPSRTMVRVSFIPMEPPLTQADVRQEVLANKQQVLRDLADVWREESPTVWAGVAKDGVKEVGRPSFAVEPIGGQTALIISYGRTSTANPTETMRVTQYHVPLGAEKALITLSYIEGDQQAIASHNRLKNSIVIR